MRNRNCPNCGAAVDFENNKCSYCGTSYYDLSCMKMDEPFFMSIDLAPYSSQTVLAKVRINRASLLCEPDSLPEIDLSLVCFQETLKVKQKDIERN